MADRHEIIAFTPEGTPIPNPRMTEEDDEYTKNHEFEEDYMKNAPTGVEFDEEFFHSDDIMSPSPIRTSTDVNEDYADEDGHSTGELDEVVMDAEKLREDLGEARKQIQKLRATNKELQRENEQLHLRLKETENKPQQAEENLSRR